MKSLSILITVMVTLGLTSGSLYAALPASLKVPGKTMGDFKKAYSHTKSSVARQKFHSYKALEKASSPTLSSSRIRIAPNEMKTLADYKRAYAGTKSIVAHNKYHELKGKEKGAIHSQRAPDKRGLVLRESKNSF